MARRFIAGAVCPECQQMDKIVTYKKDGEDVAECVSCGYLSLRPKEDEVRAENKTSYAKDAGVGVVKIVP
ncbi:MAG: hypothetical protein COA99_02930 [Moraxellaceae bacterium]|nr:MAG: hypothetical protein COA99_02930 [Moraxellaceae bacterium]